ncbi:MAG: hypothetical protein AB1921_13050 [Thermodesulfobacteriota bacterium]
MSIMPEGEDLRRAVKWISEKRCDNPGLDLKALVNEASVKFNLSPLDEEFLFRKIVEQKNC